MKQFKEEWEAFRNKRYRLIKRFLHYLPSRSRLQKNSFFRRFGSVLLDKRLRLWSFSYKSVRAAYYAGWILTCWPVMGIQIPCAIILAIIFRANVLILVALQMISNPFTIGFMYPLEFYTGKWILSWLPVKIRFIEQASLKEMLIAIKSGSWEKLFSIGVGGFFLACVGGTVLGVICAYISCFIHKRTLRNFMMDYERFVIKRMKELDKL